MTNPILIVRIALFVPHADNPATGDLIESDPLEFPIPAAPTPPAGWVVQCRRIVKDLCDIATKHKPKAPPTIIMPEAPKLVLPK